jgi:hypothetical protein
VLRDKSYGVISLRKAQQTFAKADDHTISTSYGSRGQ